MKGHHLKLACWAVGHDGHVMELEENKHSEMLAKPSLPTPFSLEEHHSELDRWDAAAAQVVGEQFPLELFL